MDAISHRQVLACGLARMASRRQLSKSLHASASPKPPTSRCDLSLPEIPSSPAGSSPSISAGPGLTNGCRLTLGSNVRKTALVKAFGQPGDSLQRSVEARAVLQHPPCETNHLMEQESACAGRSQLAFQSSS